MKERFNKIWKALTWVGLAAAQAVLVWFGLHGQSVCWNIFAFVTWFLCALYLLAVIGQYAVRSTDESAKLPQRSVPMHISMLYDFLLACLLAAFGHFFYAGMIVVEQLLEQMAHSPKPPRKAKPSHFRYFTKLIDHQTSLTLESDDVKLEAIDPPTIERIKAGEFIGILVNKPK